MRAQVLGSGVEVEDTGVKDSVPTSFSKLTPEGSALTVPSETLKGSKTLNKVSGPPVVIENAAAIPCQEYTPDGRSPAVGRGRENVSPAHEITEEKHLARPHWTSKITAEVRKADRSRLARGMEKVARVEGVVAQKFESCAVKIISTGLGDDVYVTSRCAAVFGGLVSGLHAEFGNRIEAAG